MKGLVKETKGNLLTVHIVRREACGECRACLSGMMENDMDIEAKNLCDAEVGDWVELELQENAFFNAVMIMYGLPLVGFFAGVLLGYFIVGPFLPIPVSLTSIVFGALGIFLCYLWIKSQNARWESGKYRPLAVSLAEEDDAGSCGI
ncbi:MAG: SoxR reducing system RseC family protein [Anaerotignum sp.]|nr:SoxR reducing system RseC family protein [Anaerotignum sp.]